MTGRPEITYPDSGTEIPPAELLNRDEVGEDAEIFLGEHFALLPNHFSPAFIKEHPWLSATEIQARWNQREIEIAHVSSVGRRIRRIAGALSEEFPQIPSSAWINKKERSQRFSPLAVAITETIEGPWPRAVSCLPLSEWAELTGTEESFLERYFREKAGRPTFCLSDFFHTNLGLHASFPLARQVLFPLKTTIGQVNAEAAKREIEHIIDLKRTLAPLMHDFRDLLENLNPKSHWRGLAIQVKRAIGSLSEEELILSLNLHQHRVEAERALIGLNFYKDPGKEPLKTDLEEVLKFTRLVDYCFTLGFLLPKALRIAREYYGQHLPLTEDLVGECLLSAIELMNSRGELNLKRLTGEMRNRIKTGCTSAGKGIGWRVNRHIGAVEKVRGRLGKTLEDGDDVGLIAELSGLNLSQVKRALEAFKIQLDLSLRLLTREQMETLSLKDHSLEEIVEETIFRETLLRVLDSLPEGDKKILSALYIQGKSLEELAAEMGRGRTSVGRARDRVLEKIREDPGLRDWFI